jgi:signal transduction histidine kinase
MIESTLITDLLEHRPSRQPDYAAENHALHSLIDAMNDPGSVMYELVRTAMELCRGDSAGISVLEQDGDEDVFRWHAISGDFAINAGQTQPRFDSPCAVVLERADLTLFEYPHRAFGSLCGYEPVIVEALLYPFYSGGQLAGTLWVLSHREDRRFDREDARVLMSLARFATGALRLLDAVNSSARRDELSRAVGARERELEHATTALRKEIEQRTSIESALKASESRYRLLFESIDQGFYIASIKFDENGSPVDIFYEEANPAAARITKGDYTGRWLSEITNDYEHYWYEVFGRVARTGENIHDEHFAAPLNAWIEFNAFQVSEDDARIAIIFSDVTTRKMAETALIEHERELAQRVDQATTELRRLSRRLLTVQEAERRKIAYELHDQIGQLLTGLSFSLEMARRSVPSEHLDQASGITDMLSEQIRSLTLELRPPVLDDKGLIPALLALADRYPRETGVEVVLTHEGATQRFPRDVETTAYRVIQEALTNVARHSGADSVSVRIRGNDDLQIWIKDAGSGFDLEAVRQSGTTAGLAGMQERVSVVGGALEIETNPGMGTVISVTLPTWDSRADRTGDESR